MSMICDAFIDCVIDTSVLRLSGQAKLKQPLPSGSPKDQQQEQQLQLSQHQQLAAAAGSSGSSSIGDRLLWDHDQNAVKPQSEVVIRATTGMQLQASVGSCHWG